MSDSAMWQDFRSRLDAIFVSTAERLRECNPNLWFQSGWRTTGRWPFDAWAEFSRIKNPARIEDIVVFFRIEPAGNAYADNAYIANVDISTGEGLVLADRQAHVFTVESSETWASEMITLTADVKQFIDEHMDALRDALC